MQTEKNPARLIIALLLEIAIFIVDIFIHPGYATWLLYFFPLFLVFNVSVHSIFAVDIFATVLMISQTVFIHIRRSTAYNFLA